MNNHHVTKIISGGQSGADLAGLITAKKLGLETGGWTPKNFKTEDGPKPELGLIYGLKCLKSEKYPDRTKKNVDDSDGTLIFRLKSSPGSDLTIGYAQTGIWKYGDKKSLNINETKHRPICIIDDLSNTKNASKKILDFVVHNDIKILNVAGHRESSAPIENFSSIIQKVLFDALKN